MGMKVEAKGYVKFPEVRKGNTVTFKLNMASKQKDGTKKYSEIKCVQFKTSTAPEDGAFVTVNGFLNESEFTSQEGVTKKTWEIAAQSVEAAPPFADGGKPGHVAPKAEKDPWDA